MGVDYLIISTLGDNIITNESYAKYAWSDIRWKLVFKLLNINLDVLYGCPILSKWPPQSVEMIYYLLVKLYDNPSGLFDDETDIENAIYLKDDIQKLRDLFKDYVERKCEIQVF